MNFYNELSSYPWNEVARRIADSSRADAAAALGGRSLSVEGLMRLLSPAAESMIEEIAQKAHRITLQRFGKVISLFAPLYLSNQCINGCIYCGFNRHNPVERITLTPAQAYEEGKYLHSLGFRNLLLVSGESPNLVTMEYLRECVGKLRSLFPSVSVEIYPMSTDQYEELCGFGVDGLVVFQETYDEKRYGEVHPEGRKRDYHRRLETPERGGAAGFRRLGIGALLGLDDWRVEGLFLGLHARYLLRRFWKSQVSISFPRLQPAAGGFSPPDPVSDLHFVQLIAALRVFLPDVGFTLSTREPSELRDHLIPLGITSMSAGSRTDPGGYTQGAEAGAQFSIADERPPHVVAQVIRERGYDPVWKDWDNAL